jgi:hypothetical protein
MSATRDDVLLAARTLAELSGGYEVSLGHISAERFAKIVVLLDVPGEQLRMSRLSTGVWVDVMRVPLGGRSALTAQAYCPAADSARQETAFVASMSEHASNLESELAAIDAEEETKP